MVNLQETRKISGGELTEKIQVDFFVTQFLSGHGYYLAYLHRMGKVADSDCLYCPGIADTAEHTFFECDRWNVQRAYHSSEIGVVFATPENIVGAMLQGEGDWDRVRHFAHAILRANTVNLDRR